MMRHALILLLFVCAASGAGATAPTLRAGLSYGFDGNLFEAVDEDRRVSGGFVRLEADLEQRPVAAAGGLLARLRWATEQFPDHRSQDRALWLTGLGWRLRRGLTIGEWSWTGQWSQRRQADSLSWGRQHLTHTGAAWLTPRTRLSWTTTGIWVDTEPGGPSGRRGWRVGAEAMRRVTAHLRASLRAEGGETRFDEPAIAAWDQGTLRYRDGDQCDRDHRWGLGVAWEGTPRLELEAGYRRVDSNSLGFSHGRVELSATVAGFLPAAASGQLLARWQSPRYDDGGLDRWRLREDPEDPDLGARSSLTLLVRRPVGHDVAIEVQGGWERNESRISGRYYEKTLLRVGVRCEVDPR